MTNKRFSTFEGVFTPCLLSILGVIMYLRLGFVVGSIGLGGAFLIIAFANLITLFTALSMSSVVTNIRIGPGGAYSIISKSLGLEAGGAIGIPLYIAQAISIAFYVAGFAECWGFIFPSQDRMMISLIVWLLVLVIAYSSAKLAFRIQYVVMAIIVASIVSIMLGKGINLQPAGIWSEFSITEFWRVFAIFFPAVTGVLAGASMSGELTDPKKSIPVGTIGAILVSLGIYLLLAFWFYKQIPLTILKANTEIAMEMGRWRWLVVAGIMGATLSSALTMAVGSPRILLALGRHSLLPFSSMLTRVNKRGEPTSAILFTALISLITILMGSLNQIAGLLTMFFLITYGMINLTVFIEEMIGIASFRPTFRISRIIPLLGTIGCLSVMFLIDQKFSLIALMVIIGVYLFLLRRSSNVYAPDVRSGVLVFLAEKFAKTASRLPYYPKIWKPNILLPVFDLDRFTRLAPVLQAIVIPSGRITAIKVLARDQNEARPKEELEQEFRRRIEPFKDRDIFVEAVVVEADKVLSGTITIMQTVKGMFFPPNTLFYELDHEHDYALDRGILEEASKEGLGIIILRHDDKTALGQDRVVNLWIRRQSPNINLAILIALQLEKNWEGAIRLIQSIDSQEEHAEAHAYLEKLKNVMRVSANAQIEIMIGLFMESVSKAPPAGINVFGMGETFDIEKIHEVADTIRTPILFLRDSAHESALA